MKKQNRAFTLIELLVVVLIIDILAAIALPQYNKAVEKARTAEAITVLNTLQKAIDVYVLENGLVTLEDNAIITFLGTSDKMNDEDTSEYMSQSLDIEISGLIGCAQDSENVGYCYSNHFIYYAFCSPDVCSIYASRGTNTEWNENGQINGGYLGGKYTLEKSYYLGKWTNSCYGNCPSGLVW